MSDKYTINKETLTAVADTIRRYTGKVGNATHRLSTAFTKNASYSDGIYISSLNQRFEGGEITSPIAVYFYEDIDSNGNLFDMGNTFYNNTDKTLRYWGMLPNDKGELVPALCPWYESSSQEGWDCYYYISTTQIDGNIYDKWRKIEPDEGNGDNYTWNSVMKNFIYTEPVVVSVVDLDQTIAPQNFPEKIAEVYTIGLSASGIKNANEEVY